VTDQEILARFDALEKEIAALKKRQPTADSPFVRRTEAIQLLKTRSVLEACEHAGWLKATTRQRRLVLYRRIDVMACVYRLSVPVSILDPPFVTDYSQ
jgi:hypothetical protein